MKKIPFFRRQYIVDKGKFQGKFLIPFVLSWFLAAALSTVFFNYMVHREIDKLLWRAHVTIDTTDQIIGQIFLYTVAVTFVLLFILLAGSCWFIRQKSNGVAIRMVKDLDMVAKGDFSKIIWLRKKDEFKEVAAALNQFIEDRRMGYQQLQNGLNLLGNRVYSSELAAARKQLTSEDLQQLGNIVRDLRQQMPLGAVTKNVEGDAVNQ